MEKLVLLPLSLTLSISIAFAQPIVKIWNSEDSLATLHQISQYLDYLDVREDIYVHVSFSEKMPDNLEGITFVKKTLPNEKYPFDKVIKVKIKAHMSNRKQRLVLAHEMIHVKQYAKGEIRVIDQHHVIWKERTYSNLRPTDRRYTPWEHEAYRNDVQLAKARMEQPQVSPVASYTGIR
ncbi:hypothetical protein [Catalinimonas niigatensis]|uniref:hypothetical protein n=1 Tax=Catalinimonas niigatensis TaxID=1397264 RepID=UPI0026671A99|nr:hypothetical protein [Catalinimonas niigatensis]WPP53548.1 hypothetical protein PZB72_14330 [Catalinimonas niigatensis]